MENGTGLGDRLLNRTPKPIFPRGGSWFGHRGDDGVLVAPLRRIEGLMLRARDVAVNTTWLSEPAPDLQVVSRLYRALA